MTWTNFRCEKYPYKNNTIRCHNEARFILKYHVYGNPSEGNQVNYQSSLACESCMKHIVLMGPFGSSYDVFEIGNQVD
jgi:hypothetical protein